ncbi:Uncharacterised protein [Helicobacter pametensis]|nr:Uncharacterised protein [Helicobacter pametensis]
MSFAFSFGNTVKIYHIIILFFLLGFYEYTPLVFPQIHPM